MFIKLARLIFLSLISVLATWNILPAHAQNGNETVEFTLEDLGYSDVRLNGLYGVNTMWIPFQSDWPVGNMEIELTYTASPLLNSREAILTVLADNKEITSIRPIGNGRDQTVSFVVPLEGRLAGGVSITYEGYLRLSTEFCEDSFNIGQWLIVRNSSRIRLGLNEISAAPQLNDLPEAIMVQGAIDVPEVVFVLPEQADDLTLTTATQVAYRLGANGATGNLPIEIATADTLTEQQEADANLVVFGLPDNQPFIARLIDSMPVPPANAGFVSQDRRLIPPTDGVVQIFKSPWNPSRNILVVSGNGEAGLAMAGEAFVHDPTFESLTGSFYFIRTLANPTGGLDQKEPWLTPNTSFSQLGEFDRQIAGLGITDANYYFLYPPGLMFGESAQLVLHLAFSPALQTNNIYAAVYINDIFIGTVNASTTNEDSWIALNLPVQSLNQYARKDHARELNVVLSIGIPLPVNNCDQVDKDSNWVRIYADSYFQPNFVSVDIPDLYFFPYPFISLHDTEPVGFVLPGNPTNAELQATMSLAALLKNGIPGDVDLHVIQSAETPQALAGSHFILIGTPARNPLISEVTAHASISFENYQELDNSPPGFFHTMASPWDENMSVLAVFGDTEDGFNASVSSIYEQGKLVRESGSIAVVRSGGEPVVIYREAELPLPELLLPEEIASATSSDGNPTDSAAPPISPNQVDPGSDTASQPAGDLTGTERLILIITVFLVILVAAVALIRIAWRIRA